MADEDFDPRPIRRPATVYKRKKTIIVEDKLALDFLQNTDKVEHDHTTIKIQNDERGKDHLKHEVHRSVGDETVKVAESDMTDLEAFLANKHSFIQQHSSMLFFDNEDLTVETTPKSKDKEFSQVCRKRRKLSTEEIKEATALLCKDVKGRKQSSLIDMMKSKSVVKQVKGSPHKLCRKAQVISPVLQSVKDGTYSSPAAPLLVNLPDLSLEIEETNSKEPENDFSPHASPEKEAAHLEEASAFPTVEASPKTELEVMSEEDTKGKQTFPTDDTPRKTLIKQVGTNQLDLGAMFGLKPKVTDTPKKSLFKQAGTNQLDLGAMFGMKPKTPDQLKTPRNYPEKERTPRQSQWSTKNKDGSAKEAPSWKFIPGTSFTVDAFNFGNLPSCSHYFLSHFHSDHYAGLNKKFNSTVYCSQITANYVISTLGVNKDRVIPLKFEEEYEIDGVLVQLIPANHCPGAAMIYFTSLAIGKVLHTGDFRFCETMLEHPLIKGQYFNSIYLDTTYFDPNYSFPPQQDVINFVRSIAAKADSDTMFVSGTYTIGKELVFQALAEELDCKICIAKAKLSILKQQDNPALTSRLVLTNTAQVHVTTMKDITHPALSVRLAKTQYKRVIGIKPTGWTNRTGVKISDVKPVKKGVVEIYYLPYSEHSSYAELETFVKSVPSDKVISTVLPGAGKKRDFMFGKIKEWKEYAQNKFNEKGAN